MHRGGKYASSFPNVNDATESRWQMTSKQLSEMYFKGKESKQKAAALEEDLAKKDEEASRDKTRTRLPVSIPVPNKPRRQKEPIIFDKMKSKPKTRTYIPTPTLETLPRTITLNNPLSKLITMLNTHKVHKELIEPTSTSLDMDGSFLDEYLQQIELSRKNRIAIGDTMIHKPPLAVINHLSYYDVYRMVANVQAHETLIDNVKPTMTHEIYINPHVQKQRDYYNNKRKRIINRTSSSLPHSINSTKNSKNFSESDEQHLRAKTEEVLYSKGYGTNFLTNSKASVSKDKSDAHLKTRKIKNNNIRKKKNRKVTIFTPNTFVNENEKVESRNFPQWEQVIIDKNLKHK